MYRRGMYGILTDKAILAAVESGSIKITPFEPKNLNPASVDLTLGDEVVVYENWVKCYPRNMEMVENGRNFRPAQEAIFDVKDEPKVQKFKIHPQAGWVLNPGIGYLLCTRERIWTDKYVPIVDGKSSVGRLFMLIHFCAGFGDVGFDGQYTLEVSVMHALKVYPGMRVAQIRFHTMHGEVGTPYDKVGHYVGEAATGAVSSLAYKQFKEG